MWSLEGVQRRRSIDSVILPSATKHTILQVHTALLHPPEMLPIPTRIHTCLRCPDPMSGTDIAQDMDEFLAPATRAWYTEHGIPYKVPAHTCLRGSYEMSGTDVAYGGPSGATSSTESPVCWATCLGVCKAMSGPESAFGHTRRREDITGTSISRQAWVEPLCAARYRLATRVLCDAQH